jgi:hypothetical protein
MTGSECLCRTAIDLVADIENDDVLTVLADFEPVDINQRSRRFRESGKREGDEKSCKPRRQPHHSIPTLLFATTNLGRLPTVFNKLSCRTGPDCDQH